MKKNNISLRFFATMILALLLTGCVKSSDGLLNDADALATAVEATVQARLSTQLALPTATLPATQAVVATPATTPTNVAYGCLKASMVNETVVDGTLVQRAFPFTKTWKIRNTGSCAWPTSFKFVFVGGDAMGAPSAINLPMAVEAGQILDISLDMVAPAEDGTYTGYWSLQSDAGVNIAPFSVQIVVAEEGGAFTVTNVETTFLDVENLACPFTHEYEVKITTNGAGTVSYYVEDSVSGVGVTQSVNFATSETKISQHTMEILREGSYWMLVYVSKPNGKFFGPFTFTVACD